MVSLDIPWLILLVFTFFVDSFWFAWSNAPYRVCLKFEGPILY